MMSHRNLTSTPRPSVVSLSLSQAFSPLDETERAQLALERASKERVQRMLQSNDPLVRIVSRAFVVYSYFGLLSWIVMGIFLWTSVSDVIIDNCPESELIHWKMFILVVWGIASWGGVIQKGRYLPLLIFCFALLFIIYRFGNYLHKLSQYNLTDEEMDFYEDHFANSGSKLLPIGQCMLGHKMAMAMVHFEFVLAATLALLYFVPLLVNGSIALGRSALRKLIWTKYYP